MATYVANFLRLANGESLHLRIVRSLGSLLVSNPSLATEQHRPLFEDCLRHAGSELPALTVLIGLWPASRDQFIDKLPKNYRFNPQDLTHALAVAGFGPLHHT